MKPIRVNSLMLMFVETKRGTLSTELKNDLDEKMNKAFRKFVSTENLSKQKNRRASDDMKKRDVGWNQRIV